MRRHRSCDRRRPAVSHGTRTRRLTQARWARIGDLAFSFLDAPQGFPLSDGERAQLSEEAEGALLVLAGVKPGEILRPLEFGAEIWAEELLVWLERSFEQGLH